jgi:hypothetical protein
MLFSLLALGCSDYDLNRPDDVRDPNDSGDWSDPDGPEIEVEPMSVDFGGALKGCESVPETITVKNIGAADLVVSAIEVQGSTVFGSDGVPVTIAAGDASTFEVVFTPEAWVSYEGEVVVYSNDANEAEVAVELEGRGAEDATYDEMFEQDYFQNVDVLWVVDNSGSMSGALAAVNASFSSFMTEFLHLGLDYRIAVVTTDMHNPDQSGQFMGAVIDNSTADPEGEFGAQVDQGASGSGQEQGFGACEAALTEPLISTVNAGFLREDASLATIVVTDEDDDTDALNAVNFSTWYNGLKADPSMATFSAISGPADWPCSDFTNGVSASPAPEYIDAVGLTGGIHQSICANEWDKALQHLSLTAAGMDYEFCLTHEPSNIGQMVVQVDGEDVEYDYTDGYIYDVSSNCLVFSGDAIPGPGGIITVSYPVEGTCE